MKILKSQRGVALILELILVAVVFTAIGAVGYQWYQKNYNKPATTTETESKKQEEKKEKDPYEGWKTYTHEAQGISLKYPGDWTLTSTGTGGVENILIKGPNGMIVRYRYGTTPADGPCSVIERSEVVELQGYGKAAIQSYSHDGVDIHGDGGTKTGRVSEIHLAKVDSCAPWFNTQKPQQTDPESEYTKINCLTAGYVSAGEENKPCGLMRSAVFAVDEFYQKPEVVIALKIFKTMSYK